MPVSLTKNFRTVRKVFVHRREEHTVAYIKVAVSAEGAYHRDMRVPHAFKVRNRFVDSCHMVYENVGYFLAVLKYYSVYQNPDTRFDHIEDDFMVFFVRQRRPYPLRKPRLSSGR